MSQCYFHMSGALFSVGYVINANGKEKVDQRIEDELEKKRPPEALRRREAVFCLGSTDFTVCGVTSPGYIYRVEPQGIPQQRDFAWIGEMQQALLKIKYPNLIAMKSYPDWDDDLIGKCCSGYWSGAGTGVPGWEYLAPSCTVREIIADTLVDPKNTKGGWKT
jgi:hypothetical protein